jgi:hypothetical protein
LANTFKCSLPFRQSGFLLWEAGYVIGNWFVELAKGLGRWLQGDLHPPK